MNDEQLNNIDYEEVTQYWKRQQLPVLFLSNRLEKKESWKMLSPSLITLYFLNTRISLNNLDNLLAAKQQNTINQILELSNYLPFRQALFLFLWIDKNYVNIFPKMLSESQFHRAIHKNSYANLFLERINLIDGLGLFNNLFSELSKEVLKFLNEHK